MPSTRNLFGHILININPDRAPIYPHLNQNTILAPIPTIMALTMLTTSFQMDSTLLDAFLAKFAKRILHGCTQEVSKSLTLSTC